MRRVIWFAVFLVALVIVAWNVLWHSGYFQEGKFGAAQPASVAVATEPIPLSPQEQVTMSPTMQNVVEESAPALGPTYINKRFSFSVQMPQGFRAQELPGTDADGGGQIVTLQNAKGDGVQILITKYPEDLHELTGNDVRAAIPDMRVVQDQVVEIGDDYRGVAFMSDNEAFGGASREVWFVYPECSRGVCQPYLFQISTYARLDPLLKSMFSTWKFS